jgi:hypothetical protein
LESVKESQPRMADIQAPPEQLAATTKASQFLTVNVVMPAVGESAKEPASFARLIFGLAALALERFDAGRESDCQDALREAVSPCLAGAAVDPFDGRLLRFRQANGGYQIHSIRTEPMKVEAQ